MSEQHTQEWIKQEMEKCKLSPYYFATTYLRVKNHKGEMIPYKTILTEEQFNRQFKLLTL